MADIQERFSDNVPGRYYVDSSCILCSACEATAPENFKLSDDASHDVVYKQPEGDEEEQQCLEAMDGCPVSAIGNDGER